MVAAGALLAPVVTKPRVLSAADKQFIDRAVRHFAEVDGAVREQIRVRTNSRIANKTVCMIFGLPLVELSDLDQLDVLSDRVQKVTIDLPEQYIRVELSKNDPGRGRKRRRGRQTEEHTEWRLDEVSEDHRRHVKRILDAVEDFNELECQLSVDIKHEDAAYRIHITPCEPIKLASLQKLQREHRSLIQGLDIDLPGKKLIINVQV